jgi:hypothetical protein
MAPFKMLDGHRCRTPLFWNETRERKVFGPTYCKKPRSKFVWLWRTFESRSPYKRATSIMGEEN